MTIRRYKHVVADTLTVNVGTPTGDIADIQIWNDANELDVAETNGTPGLQMTLTFENVVAILSVFSLAYYKGAVTHHVDIEIWNYTTSAWDQLCVMETGNDYHSFFCPVFDDTDYINASGQAQVKYDHHTAGNNSHDAFFRYVALLY